MSERTEDAHHDPAWFPDPAVIDATRQVYAEALPHLDLGNLAAGLPRDGNHPMHEGEGYADALIDLTRLVEEVRFGASVGFLYAAGVGNSLQELGQKRSSHPHDLPFSNKARAYLASYIATAAPPEDLLLRPEKEMSGLRVLGGWWAAQLFDSAMMRGVAVLDRLVTLLYYVDGRAVDPDWMPAFRRRSLEKIDRWRNEPEWAELTQLLDNELFHFAKGYRDGLIHRRRFAAELHGDYLVGRWTAEGSAEEQGFTPDEHFAIVEAFYKDVMQTAITATTTLIVKTNGPTGA